MDILLLERLALKFKVFPVAGPVCDGVYEKKTGEVTIMRRRVTTTKYARSPTNTTRDYLSLNQEYIPDGSPPFIKRLLEISKDRFNATPYAKSEQSLTVP